MVAARFLLLCCVLLGWSCAVQAVPKDTLDRANLTNFMSGDYIIVGKKPDLDTTYTGRLTFHRRGERLRFVRTVGGRTERGIATLEMTRVGDPVPVLRMHFKLDGQPHDGIYQWKFDYDNYARFTGYVYRPDTKAAGLEMLFPAEPAVRD